MLLPEKHSGFFVKGVASFDHIAILRGELQSLGAWMQWTTSVKMDPSVPLDMENTEILQPPGKVREQRLYAVKIFGAGLGVEFSHSAFDKRRMFSDYGLSTSISSRSRAAERGARSCAWGCRCSGGRANAGSRSLAKCFNAQICVRHFERVVDRRDEFKAKLTIKYISCISRIGLREASLGLPREMVKPRVVGGLSARMPRQMVLQLRSAFRLCRDPTCPCFTAKQVLDSISSQLVFFDAVTCSASMSCLISRTRFANSTCGNVPLLRTRNFARICTRSRRCSSRNLVSKV